jgi:hypothetical protein
VRRYRAGDATAMPLEVVGLGDLRVFGRAGDAALAFPRVRTLGDLELLPPDVQFGLDLANRTVEAHRRLGPASPSPRLSRRSIRRSMPTC